MKEPTLLFVGLDVRKDSIAVAHAQAQRPRSAAGWVGATRASAVASAISYATSHEMVEPTVSVPLEQQSWKGVTVHHVHLAFLGAELNLVPGGRDPAGLALVSRPDLTDAEQNSRREELLYRRRAPLLTRIPSSTSWFEVRLLEEHHLNQLLVIGRCGWDSTDAGNELLDVARRRPEVLRSPPNEWNPPIFWGHDRRGPFTILEGNHRLVAYCSTTLRPALRIPVYIGLSAERCHWHLPDPVAC